MDFLDPKKQKRHRIRLWIGYVLVGIALLLATIILLYQAYGYRINRQGEIIQNGLVFMSSQPSDALIYANGKDLEKRTNTQLRLAAGQYTFELVRDGYHTWKRGVTVEGGSVQRFSYPFLFPTDLRTSSVKQYSEPPVLTAQSDDNRWLLVFSGSNNFDIYDLSKDKIAPQQQTIPSDVLAASSTTTNWREVQWADDNRHVVLQRTFNTEGQDNQTEYILYDREKPAESRNITNLLGFNPTKLELRDSKYDQYYAFDSKSHVLFTATLGQPTPQVLLQKVLDFEHDGSNTLIYATNDGAAADKTSIKLRQDEQDYDLRQVPRGDKFVLEIASFNGSLITAAGVTAEDRVFVYRNPLESLRDGQAAAPLQILKANNPTQAKFSANSRFVMVQSGNNFAVYDAETDRGYAYQLKLEDGAVSTGAAWMDGFHMTVVSKNKVVAFDFDGTNQHTLMSGRRGFVPAFSPDYRFMYALSPENKLNLGNLRTEADE